MEGFRHIKEAFQGKAWGLGWLGSHGPGTGRHAVGQPCSVAKSTEPQMRIIRNQPKSCALLGRAGEGGGGREQGPGVQGNLVALSF